MIIDRSKANLLEKDIEDYLWHNPSEVYCDHFRVARWIKRQYQVHSGILDLLGVTDNYHLVIVEVKNVPIDASALTQVSRYAFDVANVADKAGDIYMGHDHGGLHVYKMVIGRSISNKTMLEADKMIDAIEQELSEAD